MFTGVRRGEALGLTSANVDRARGVILLTETKNGKPRDVQLYGILDVPTVAADTSAVAPEVRARHKRVTRTQAAA